MDLVNIFIHTTHLSNADFPPAEGALAYVGYLTEK